MLKNVVNQYFFATVGANHAQMERLRESLTAMVTGWSVDQVKEIINESIHSAIGPMIYDEAATLIEKHISDGRDIIIVSTSGKEIVEPIGKLLGATTVIATETVTFFDTPSKASLTQLAYSINGDAGAAATSVATLAVTDKDGNTIPYAHFSNLGYYATAASANTTVSNFGQSQPSPNVKTDDKIP